MSPTARAALIAASVAALPVAAAAGQGTEVWSTPTRTEQVDPRRMGPAEPVSNPGPVEAALAGAWELWVPGGVWYRRDGETVYRRYTPGATLNRLMVDRDGGYVWDGRRGRLVEVRPWHAQPGVRYYRISHAGGGSYEMYLCTRAAIRQRLCGTEGRLVLLQSGVGGHAATGTRIGGRAAPARTRGFRPGDGVSVEWRGSWYDATVLRVGQGRYLVHYDGWSDSWDEWVAPARIRRRD